MRGVLIGLIISAMLWLLIIAAVLSQSVMAELGHRAVESGVIK